MKDPHTPKQKTVMTVTDVIDLYAQINNLGIELWLDGGWGVDALLGEQTRPHEDLDIVVQQKDVPKLRGLLAVKGYKDVERDDTSVMYPAHSLTGQGKINGQPVKCISAEYMVKFHTGYELDENDRKDARPRQVVHDVEALFLHLATHGDHPRSRESGTKR